MCKQQISFGLKYLDLISSIITVTGTMWIHVIKCLSFKIKLSIDLYTHIPLRYTYTFEIVLSDEFVLLINGFVSRVNVYKWFKLSSVSRTMIIFFFVFLVWNNNRCGVECYSHIALLYISMDSTIRIYLYAKSL